MDPALGVAADLNSGTLLPKLKALVAEPNAFFTVSDAVDGELPKVMAAVFDFVVVFIGFSGHEKANLTTAAGCPWK